MQALCFTGWQQEQDALACIMPDAMHFEYAAYDNIESMFAAIPREPEIAVGWSLGGQLLARAISAGHIRPEKLFLIAAPFQFMANENFPEGSSTEEFEKIREHYRNTPQEMVKEFQSFIGYGDVKQVSPAATQKIWKNGLFWLEELGKASCHNLNFRTFPETIIIHGRNDKVIIPAHARKFAQMLPGAELMLIPGCAHAPHLHDPETLKQLINARV